MSLAPLHDFDVCSTLWKRNAAWHMAIGADLIVITSHYRRAKRPAAPSLGYADIVKLAGSLTLANLAPYQGQ